MCEHTTNSYSYAQKIYLMRVLLYGVKLVYIKKKKVRSMITMYSNK